MSNNDYNLKILHQNVQSIKNKIDHLEISLKTEDVDIACISEHWLRTDETNVKIEGYSLCSIYCRSVVKNGGVAIYCKHDLRQNITELNCLQDMSEDKNFEICGIELTMFESVIKIITIYRSPSSNFDIFIDRLDKILSMSCVKANCKIIICGDLNIDYSSNCKQRDELIDVFSSYNVVNLVNDPTRIHFNSSTSIDYMCTNFNSTDMSCDVVENVISDHTAQILSLNLNSVAKANEYMFTRLLSRRNYDTLLALINRETWFELYNCQDVNEAFTIFVNTLKYYIDTSFPVIRINTNRRSNRKSWITKGIRISSKTLKKLYKKYKNTNEVHDRDYYRRYKQIYRKVMKNAKESYNSDYYCAAENKTKAVWHIINNNIVNKNNKTKINEIRTHNRTITDIKEVAEFFNNYFVDTPKKLVDQLDKKSDAQFRITAEYPIMFLGPVNEMEIYNVIMGLKNSNSVGVDEISANILKAVVNYVVKPITYLVNLSFEHGIFPDILKIAKVVPLYKKGDCHLVENYRPVSILSTVSKILEKVLCNNIVCFLSRFNILNKAQHGFRKNRSTNSAIFEFLNGLYENLDNNKRTIGLFMDLTKAFDLVDHSLLLDKLEAYGLKGKVNEYIKSYLRGRTQIVEIDKIRSHPEEVKQGVPQGSVLGPLLFILFVNDLPTANDNKNIVMFADDNSCICSENKILDTVRNTQIVLDKFVDWFSCNKLFLNTTKTVFIQFTPRLRYLDNSYLVKCNGKSIEQVTDTKFLGLYIDNGLSWESHIDKLSKNMSSVCFALYRLKQVGNRNIMMSYYYAAMYSRIKYAIAFWGCSHHTIRIFRLQKRAIIIAGVSKLTSCRTIFKEYNLLTMPCMYIMETLMLVKSNYEKFVQNNHYHVYNTRRGENYSLPIHSLAIYEKNPAYIGIKLYNKLPDDIKNIRNIHSFKGNVKKLLINKCYYSVQEYLDE